MADVVIAGAGMNGLTTALLLAKDGHAVTVIERDPAPPPPADEAWDAWERRGVNQFRMLHFFQPRWRQIVETELPELADAFMCAGALRFNLLEPMPDGTTGAAEIDADCTALTARRPVAEAALASVTDAARGIAVRRGEAIEGLVTGTSVAAGVPHVTGLAMQSGEVLAADIVIDATGRRSPLPAWLAAAGARPIIEHEEDLGFQYYGRHFRCSDEAMPEVLGGLLQPYESVSVLTLPADNGTYGVGIITSGKDAELRSLKDNDTWMRVLRSYPLVAHWADGDPLDDVAIMAKIPDRYRRFVVDGVPVATGVFAVGDSWACTNPSLGRGITLGIMHAIELRDLLRGDLMEDPYHLALAWDEITESALAPWYETTVAYDRHRLAEISAQIACEPYDPGDPEWEITKALFRGAGRDPDVMRGFLRFAGLLWNSEEMLAEPGLFEKIIEAGADWRDAPPDGPGRRELLDVVHA